MIIETIPNVSEGRRADVVAALGDAVRAVDGAALLDLSSDPAHNRSVVTIAGSATALADAVIALFDIAVARIDLRTHDGVHPRLGAVDVVPFVPIQDVTLADCDALARTVGAHVAERFGIPVYLYEASASAEHRRRLENIRRGQFEGLAAKMQLPEWAPDFGPARPHPSAGASVIGARRPLIAYNVNLATPRVDVAKRIAATIRESSGGLRGVKAMGLILEDRGIAQVSMNLTDYRVTGMRAVFDAIALEAARHGVAIAESELIGLVPEDALSDDDAVHILLRNFSAARTVEGRIREVEKLKSGKVEKLKSGKVEK